MKPGCASTSGRPRDGAGGFTLIEVLAAFVVLALFTIAIQRNVVTAARTLSQAEARIGAEAVAATLLDGPLAGPDDGPGPKSGTLNGFSWTLRVEPVPVDRFGAGASGREAPAWLPVRVTVTVAGTAAGRPVASAEIVRLIRVAPP